MGERFEEVAFDLIVDVATGANVALVEFQFDTQVVARAVQSPQMGHQAVRFAEVGIVASDDQIGSAAAERLLPLDAELPFRLARRIVEQTDVGATRFAGQDGSERVDAHMKRRAAGCDGLGNEVLYRFPMRSVIAADDFGFGFLIKTAGEFGEQRAMCRRTVELDQQSGDGRSDERCVEMTSQRLAQCQRTWIVPTMAGERGPSVLKQWPIALRHPVAAVLAGEKKRRSHILERIVRTKAKCSFRAIRLRLGRRGFGIACRERVFV